MEFGLFILIATVVAGLVAIGLFRKTVSSRRLIHENCSVSWTDLKSAMKERHLIVSHLMDATNSKLAGEVDTESLLEKLRVTEASLAATDEYPPEHQVAIELGEAETKMMVALRKLRKHLENSQTATEDRSVQACLDGLKASDGKINAAKTAYNTCVMTNLGHSNSILASLLNRCGYQALQCHEVDFNWYGSDSDLVTGV